MKEIKKALALNSGGLTEIQDASAVYFVGRDYDQAIIEAKRAISIDHTYVFGHNRLGLAYIEKKMYTEAIATLEHANALARTNTGGLGRAYALAGRHADARRILNAMLNPVRPLQIAMIHVALGEHEKALDRLEEAYRIRDGNLVLLKVFPAWDPLRSHPRFQSLLRRMNFPQN